MHPRTQPIRRSRRRSEEVLQPHQPRGGGIRIAEQGPEGGDVGGEDVQLAAAVAGGVELARGEGVGGEGGGVGGYGGVFVEEGGEEGGCGCGGVAG